VRTRRSERHFECSDPVQRGWEKGEVTVGRRKIKLPL
jgi:hypothetical protein